MDNSTGIGMIVVATIAVLIGLAFWPALSPNIGQMTQTYSIVNQTMTLPAVTATSELTMCGQRATSITITNATGGATVPTTNYTVSQSPGTDGYLAAKVTTASQSYYAGKSVNVSCAYEPKGYISEGGSRGIVALIAVFMAMLIAVAAMPNVRDKFFDFLKG